MISDFFFFFNDPATTEIYTLSLHAALPISNIIGARRAGNVVAANTGKGIALDSGTGASVVQGNYVGTDVTATKDLGNGADGIYAGSSGNQIGGKKSGTGNIVSGNAADGIRIANSKGNLVRRNIIGV